MTAIATPSTPIGSTPISANSHDGLAWREDGAPPEVKLPLVAQLVTAMVVIGPPVALIVGVVIFWNDLISLRDVAIGALLYAVACTGISVGYHRLFAHCGFRPSRALKIALAIAGSTAAEGSVIGWVSTHRHHHRFSDRAGDPHSPHGHRRLVRGLLHAHVGWLFRPGTTPERANAGDLLDDPDLVWVDRYWAWFAIASLLVPFGLGWTLSGELTGGLTTLLWAGLVRMMVLHHVTWSVNSICHAYGRRPFSTRDQSRNVGLLAVLSMGESYHNLHHAYPRSARHGVLPGQVDAAAATIRTFERLGWATDVHWPQPHRLAALQARAHTTATDSFSSGRERVEPL